MRLIDADALKKAMNEEALNLSNGGRIFIENINKLIDNAPTVEIAKDGIDLEKYCERLYGMAYEMGRAYRPQGKWIEGESGNIKCNQCGCEIRYSYLIGNKPDFPKFCCDCGAKMHKGGAENG